MSITTPSLIKLNDVRLSFPSLFSKKVWPNALTEPQYEATFILNKDTHKKEIDLINTQINTILEENKMARSKARICLRDGDLSEREEYKNSYTIATKSKHRFPIVNKDGKTPVSENDELFYAGCIVSAYINLWFYKKPSFGISANIKSIQFRKEGVAFSGQMQNIDGAFEPVESSSEENSSEEDLF